MDSINNNQFEVKPLSKRKITAPSSNVYLNPALDLLVNEDRICNTAMEIPMKKRKRTKSCDVVSFENSGLDLGVKPVNEVLVREIDNVRRTLKPNVAFKSDMHYAEISKGPEIFRPETDNIQNKERNEIDKTSKYIDRSDTEVSNDTMLKFIGDDDVDFVNTVEDISIFNDTQNKNVSITANVEDIAADPIYANFEIGNIQQKADAVFQRPVVSLITKEPMPIETTAIDRTHTKDNLLNCNDISRIVPDEIDSGIEAKSSTAEFSNSNITNIQSNVTNQVILNNSNINLSFIDRLALDSPNISDRSLYYDDDLNESNIMEIKTITIITKKKRIIEKKNTNPFLNPNIDNNFEIPKINPFLDIKPDIEYQETMNKQEETAIGSSNNLMPRRLFDTNSTISTVNESSVESQHDYENIDILHSEPIYENIDELNKQSKLLGYDVSQFNAVDIMNLNKNKNKANNSNESNDSKKEKNSFFKPGKLSKKVFKTLKKTFKHEKNTDVTLNPYEVPRKLPKQKTAPKESGIENPALNLDNSDDLEFEELSDEEHQYETIKTLRNTRLNMNVTPLRERNEDIDLSGRMNTPGKKVRFDSTLNQEKVITGNSFDCSMASPGFDAKIDKYHDELENCINERKFLQQNM